ncbi:tubulin binding cofactor C-domain-containing protein [Cercophora samala]|uniref:Tubulin binding cofactor C-domain-containing protein n=1 Tax=Cercophora samala TaxID=330535 RepID=A0AA39ZM73_9PEZI|nr:tubulin binding cofactor C-domain-containing protein [Cercophora samala]
MINMAHQEDAKEKFYRNFRIQQSNIQEQITHLPSIAPVAGERQDATEHILTNISRLTNDVRDATHFLPAYDHRVYTHAVNLLRKELDETTAKLAPKSRFQFRPRPVRTALSCDEASKGDSRRLMGGEKTTTTNGQPPISPPLSPGGGGGGGGDGGGSRGRSRSPRTVKVEGQRGAVITLPADHSRTSSAGQLTDLSGCVVNLCSPSVEASRAAPFASLTLKGIENSVVVAGHVDGPVHVTGLKKCKVAVTARQVRIHDCEEVDFYLEVRSGPIVEGCKKVRFAPLPPGGGLGTGEQGEQGGEENKWGEVKDFLWLKEGQSPNWSVLKEEDRVEEGVWRGVMGDGDEGGDVKVVLGRFGIARD